GSAFPTFENSGSTVTSHAAFHRRFSRSAPASPHHPWRKGHGHMRTPRCSHRLPTRGEFVMSIVNRGHFYCGMTVAKCLIDNPVSLTLSLKLRKFCSCPPDSLRLRR